MKRPSHGTVVAYLALFMAMSGTAVAATGGAFLLGKSNTAGATTTLTSSGAGAALALKAHSASAPALSVNTKAVVPNLNAAYLGGASLLALRPIVLVKQNRVAKSDYGTAWTNVVGMSGTINIPAGRSRPTVFTYSAECSVVGGSDVDFASLQILVDGTAVTPDTTNNGDFAFCTEGSTTGWIGASTQGYRLLAPGAHTVQVQVQTSTGGSALTRLDDMQLTGTAL
jgi:hypothetical protein